MALEKEHKELKNTLLKKNKTINSNNNINVQNVQNVQYNNIGLIAYGKEDISKIDKDDIIKALMRGFYSPLELTEKIHFNPKYPEYHNIYIPNIKDKYVMIYDGKKWNLALRDEAIDDLYDNKRGYIEDNVKNFYDKLNEIRRDALERYLDTPEDNKKIDNIKEQIKLLLYNKRNLPINNKLLR